MISKCLVPIAGKPAARWIIEEILAQGHDDLVLCINRKDEAAYKHEFRDIPVKYSITEAPLGTVGELLAARHLIEDTFVLRYLDDLTEVNYKQMLKFHIRKSALVTIAVTTRLRLPVGVIQHDRSGLIWGFEEKPLLNKPIWTAIAIMEPKALDYFEPGEDIGSNVLPRMIAADEPVYAFENDKEWYDVGNIENWKRADSEYQSRGCL
jgi:NDP-sugar pyrophosphorylase family protein